MIRAGTAIVDITPQAGLPMSGFAARTAPAIGTHDPLTVRALVVNDTAVVVADVIGLDREMSARIRKRCSLPDDRVVIAALHTHGGPVSMSGRLSLAADEAYLQHLEDACVTAIDRAVATAQHANMSIGLGVDPDVARNRRHAGGPVDRALPVLRIRDAAGEMIAVMTAYACHPVVLGADNREWTADYPHYVRGAIEAAYPGATALFLTGCAADANTGHSAHASITLNANPDRSFAMAQTLGARIAAAVVAAGETALGDEVGVANRSVALGFARRETADPATLASVWRKEHETAEPARRALLGFWIGWAESVAPRDALPANARVTCLNWGGVPIVAMPGEVFAETALAIRSHLGAMPAFVVGFADDNPGYIPPGGEYAHGGYEVDEAHRYYGLPATFASGSAETLAEAAIAVATASSPISSTDTA